MGFNTLTLSTLKPNPNVYYFIVVIFAILFTFVLFCFPFVPLFSLFVIIVFSVTMQFVY